MKPKRVGREKERKEREKRKRKRKRKEKVEKGGNGDDIYKPFG
jgi:hypothetical protein